MADDEKRWKGLCNGQYTQAYVSKRITASKNMSRPPFSGIPICVIDLMLLNGGLCKLDFESKLIYQLIEHIALYNEIFILLHYGLKVNP